jgi:hypothetical protein
MSDGRYEALRAAYARCKDQVEAERITERFLAKFDEKNADGTYKQDIPSWEVKGIWEALKGADYLADRDPNDLRESMGTSSFPQAVSGLVAKQVRRSYDEYSLSRKLVGDRLVTVKPTAKKTEKVLRFKAHPLLRRVDEGEDIQPFETGENYFGYRTCRFGRGIDITEDMVMFDQTESIWDHAKSLGNAAAISKEYLILHGIMDLQGSHAMSKPDTDAVTYVYYPSDAATSLYSASLPTGISNSGNTFTNALADWTDLQAAAQRLHNFLDDDPEKLTDLSSNTGKRIIPPVDCVALVPLALREKMFQILGSDRTAFDANNSVNPAGRGGPLYGEFHWSPLLDDQSTTSWFYGAFKEQFEYREVFPFRLSGMNRADSLELMKRGVYAWVQGEFYAGLAAMDNKFVVRCTA